MNIKNLLGPKSSLFIAVCLTIAIAWGSTFSGGHIISIQPFDFFDKVLHIVAYGALTTSWLLYVGFKYDGQKHVFLTGILVLIYGIIIEVIQGTFTANRQADFYDIFANLVGIVMAMIFFSNVLHKKMS